MCRCLFLIVVVVSRRWAVIRLGTCSTGMHGSVQLPGFYGDCSSMCRGKGRGSREVGRRRGEEKIKKEREL